MCARYLDPTPIVSFEPTILPNLFDVSVLQIVETTNAHLETSTCILCFFLDLQDLCSLCYTCTHGPYNEPGPGFLGAPYAGFQPLGPTKQDMVLNGITTDRLADRKALLASMDRFRRETDASGMMRGLDTFNQQAMGVLTSSAFRRFSNTKSMVLALSIETLIVWRYALNPVGTV